MKWFFLGLALALASGCQSPKLMRVMTYNIHHGEGVDGRLDLERIAAVITNAAPDLVALQEVDNQTRRTGGVDQAAELGRLTGMHAVFGKALDYQGGGYGLAVLSRWPVSYHETHPLPSPEPGEPRALLATKIEAGETGPVIWFASTHLDHRSETNRLAQARRIDQILSDKGTEPVLLGGDFNARPESPVMEVFTQYWLDASALDPQPTIPSRNPRRRIDYILYRPPTKWKPISTRVIHAPAASDHLPVMTVLKYLP